MKRFVVDFFEEDAILLDHQLLFLAHCVLCVRRSPYLDAHFRHAFITRTLTLYAPPSGDLRKR